MDRVARQFEPGSVRSLSVGEGSIALRGFLRFFHLLPSVIGGVGPSVSSERSERTPVVVDEFSSSLAKPRTGAEWIEACHSPRLS
jgi:hypothetical protein